MPIVVGASLTAMGLLLARGMEPVFVSTIVTTAVFVFVAIAERLVPFRAEWALSDGQRAHDIGHLFVGTLLGGGIGNVLSNALFLGVAEWSKARIGVTLWPSAWPLAAQIVLCLVAADLGRYVQHRMMHSVPLLWRFHALHHSGVQLNVWKASRAHFVERMTQQMFALCLPIAMGAPASVVAWYLIPASIIGFFAHSNADLDLGPVEYLIVGPRLHRFHHSANLDESNANYSALIVIWDVVFRTYFVPSAKGPERIGVVNDTMPREFVAQIIAPFVGERTVEKPTRVAD
jgi:sterol desaturase/sphingolipid hydroxylase (fatty acid hydroxylase superfamily)